MIILSDSDFKLRLTQIKSCTNARLPSEDAKCNGDLASLGLTEEFTSSALQWASTSATAFMSDLLWNDHYLADN